MSIFYLCKLQPRYDYGFPTITFKRASLLSKISNSTKYYLKLCICGTIKDVYTVFLLVFLVHIYKFLANIKNKTDGDLHLEIVFYFYCITI